MKHKPSKWEILRQTQSMSRRRGPNEYDALFECPRDTEDKEEGEKRVLMTFGPEIRRFREDCTSFSIGQPNHLREAISVPSISETTTMPTPLRLYSPIKLVLAHLL
jgi:hypothetical protein